MQTVDFSLIIPVYNAEIRLASLYHQTIEALNTIEATFEIILVNDCSTDTTWKVAQQLKASAVLPLTIIPLNKNAGQYASTLIGLHYAKGNFCITMDDDFCPQPVHIKTIIAGKMPTDELLYGEIGYADRTISRKYGSTVFNHIIKMCLNKAVAGNGSSFRLISKPLVHSVLKNISEPLLLDVYLINTSKAVRFIPVTIKQGYKSSYGIVGLVKTGSLLLAGIMNEKLGYKKVFSPAELICKHKI